MGNQTVHEDCLTFKYKYKLSQNKYMYRLKMALRDQVSFGLVPVLMEVKISWSTVSYLETDNISSQAILRHYILFNRYLPALL